MKIRVDEKTHRELKKAAHEALRSVTKQVILYIERGLKNEIVNGENRRPA